ncbi:hypothetical protein [Dysgonomonas termitidis]|uniref:Uncharacterized protein n=1 Tax=Dysgonomonas termitidis TaxID=1516126 RepID=A0ABV9KQX1_9BACT
MKYSPSSTYQIFSYFLVRMQLNRADIIMHSPRRCNDQTESLDTFISELESYGFAREERPFDDVIFQYVLREYPFDYIVRYRDNMRLQFLLYYTSAAGIRVMAEYNNYVDRTIRYFHYTEEVFYHLTVEIAKIVLKSEDERDVEYLLNRKLTIK